MTKHPALSAAVVVGEVRDRAQIIVDGLYAQTAYAAMEILIVDTAPHHPRLLLQTQKIPTRYLVCQESQNWGEARAMAIRAAASDVVAFTEDHSLPAPHWAEAIIRASSRPWVAAGYAFVNANPATHVSWAGFIADYLEWAHPVPEGVERMPCNNVAYRRKELMVLGDRLPSMLFTDVTICEYLRRQGHQTEIIRDAIVAHQNHETYWPLLEGNFMHCRLIGAGRVEEGSWGWPKRLAYGLSVPVLVPFMKLGRMLTAQCKRKTLWAHTIAALPASFVVFVCSSVGESLGYLFGAGGALERFKTTEISIPRSKELGADQS